MLHRFRRSQRAAAVFWVAIGFGGAGCGQPTPVPPPVAVAPQEPAATVAPAPEYYEPPKRLPAVTGNGKFSRPPRELVGPRKAPPPVKDAEKKINAPDGP